MPLPVNVATCTVTGAFVNADGSTPTGTVEFHPVPPRFADASSAPPATIVAVPRVIPLDAAGTFTIALAATDDPDLDPTGWCYLVRVRIGGHPAYSFDMAAPAGQTVDLTEVTPI